MNNLNITPTDATETDHNDQDCSLEHLNDVPDKVDKLTTQNAILTAIVQELQRKLCVRDTVVDGLRRFGMKQEQQLSAFQCVPASINCDGTVPCRLEAPLPTPAQDFGLRSC